MTPAAAVQRVLAGEHAAVYVYGVLGARTPATAQPRLWDLVRTAYTVHRGRRDQLTMMLRDQGRAPVAAATGYRLPNPARTVAEVTAAALETERRCCALYAEMVMGTATAPRQWAIEALEDAAVRTLGFGGEPEPFPGVAEL